MILYLIAAIFYRVLGYETHAGGYVSKHLLDTIHTVPGTVSYLLGSVQTTTGKTPLES